MIEHERGLFVALDDDPAKVRRQLSQITSQSHDDPAKDTTFRVVDCYSCTSLTPDIHEPYAVRGMLDLNQLSGTISDASQSLGQSVQEKKGGRRVIDSISSLMLHFEHASAQRFITQIARTAVAFGDVTTLFVLEQGSVTDQELHTLSYVMDGVLELSKKEDQQRIQIRSMKWVTPKDKDLFI